jgi:ferredoxin-thioredoxin reductase catalytic subunit
MPEDRALKADLLAFAKRHDYRLSKQANAVINSLEERKKKYGEYFCPCRVVKVGQSNRDIICPCIYVHDDIKKTGHCHCKLFEKKSVNN